jgi:hypothetical protein
MLHECQNIPPDSVSLLFLFAQTYKLGHTEIAWQGVAKY